MSSTLTPIISASRQSAKIAEVVQKNHSSEKTRNRELAPAPEVDCKNRGRRIALEGCSVNEDESKLEFSSDSLDVSPSCQRSLWNSTSFSSPSSWHVRATDSAGPVRPSAAQSDLAIS
jgi:hypothetical protein